MFFKGEETHSLCRQPTLVYPAASWKTVYLGSPHSLELVLFQDSPLHKALFWVAVAVLQLDEVNLYSAGTALLEQNLHTLDSLRIFNDKVSKLSSEATLPTVSFLFLIFYGSLDVKRGP